MSKDRSVASEPNLTELPVLPTGWCWTTLAAIASIDGGITKDQKREQTASMREVPYLRVANVQRGYLDFEEIKTILADPEEIEALRLLKGDILFTEGGDRDKLGRGWVWNDEIKDCIHQNHIFRARPSLQLVEPKFVSFHGNFFGQKWFTRTGKQTTNLASINKGVLSRFPVPLAPINEQRRIVAKIEELFTDLDAGVAALERAKANLKRYRAAVLKAAVEGRLTAEWRERHPTTEPASKLLERILDERRKRWEADQVAKFAASGKTPPKNWQEQYGEPILPDTDSLGELPQRWCWASVDQVIDIIDYRGRTPPYSDAGIPHLRSFNVKQGRIVWDGITFVSQQTYTDFMTRGLPQPGDLLFTTEAPLGEVALAPTEDIFSLAQRLMLLRPSKVGLDPRFLMYQFMAAEFQRRLGFRQTGSTVTGVSSRNFRPLPLRLPPLNEQQAIVADVEERLSILPEIEAYITRANQRSGRLRQSILKRAFEGKLVPQDPKDEPASVLLERIRFSRSMGDNGEPANAVRKRGRRVKSSDPDGQAE